MLPQGWGTASLPRCHPDCQGSRSAGFQVRSACEQTEGLSFSIPGVGKPRRPGRSAVGPNGREQVNSLFLLKEDVSFSGPQAPQPWVSAFRLRPGLTLSAPQALGPLIQAELSRLQLWTADGSWDLGPP